MGIDTFFRVINNGFETERYSITQKKYVAKEYVTDGSGNPEKILLVKGKNELIYIPEDSKCYFFEEDTFVYEIIFKNFLLKSQLGINLASPFSLIGDACFYNFMVRKIKIEGSIRLFNEKSVQIIWMIKGSLELKKDAEKINFLKEIPVLIEKNTLEYEIRGKGEIFLLKL